MYLIFDLDSKIEEVLFGWDFEYEVTFFVVQGGTWSLILHVNEDEWSDMRMLDEENMWEEVYYLGVCKDAELE